MKRMILAAICFMMMMLTIPSCQVQVVAEQTVPGLRIEIIEEELIEIDDEIIPLGLPQVTPVEYSLVMPSVAAGLALVLVVKTVMEQRRIRTLRRRLQEIRSAGL